MPVAFTNEASPSGGTGLTYLWQQKAGAGSWTNITGATGLTYTATSNLLQTTLYRRSATSGSGCGTVYSNEITVTVYPILTSGTIGTAQTICYNTIPAALTQLSAPTGGTGSYTYQWQSSPTGAAPWTTIADSALSTLAPGALAASIYYRRIVTSGSCGSATGTAIKITVNANLTAGTIGTAQSICYNATHC